MRKLLVIITFLALIISESLLADNIDKTLAQFKTKITTLETQLKKSNKNIQKIKKQTANNLKLHIEIKETINALNNNLTGKEEKLAFLESELNKSNTTIYEKMDAIKLQTIRDNFELSEKFKKAIINIDNNLIEKEEKLKVLSLDLTTTNKILNEVKTHGENDNLKFTVDFRTSINNINYKLSSGGEAKNPDLFTNRLWLNMQYSPDEKNLFKGKLSYYKVFGDSTNYSQSNRNLGYENEWITNETANNENITVKEAYWLSSNDTLMDKDIPWSVSVGKRFSADEFGIHLKEKQNENRQLAHTLNIEFDGLVSKFNLDKIIKNPKGMSLKLFAGRGLTNATPKFNISGTAYAENSEKTHDMNIYGLAFVPYDDGQYSISTNLARAENMIGFTQNYINWVKGVNNGLNPYIVTYTGADNGFQNFGNLNLSTIAFKASGIGNGINDFLDNTVLFGSIAQSKTKPKGELNGMLGSNDIKTGNSIWIGLNMPDPIIKDGRIGIEFNKGSKWWRPITYGEDAMIGSKIATRGTAIEIYYTRPINKALSFDLRYTNINYDYAGSNSFFGDDGNPDSTLNVVEASDLRTSINYKF